MNGAIVCDRCFNTLISERTGWPDLPQPEPAEEQLRGSDGRRHHIRYALRRSPGGIAVYAEESDAPETEGYRFMLVGSQTSDPKRLIRELRAKAHIEVSRQYVERDRDRWQLTGTEVRGQIGEVPDGPPGVFIDGRVLSWEDFGCALSSFTGWEFRLSFDESTPAHERGPAYPPGHFEGDGDPGGILSPASLASIFDLGADFEEAQATAVAILRERVPPASLAPAPRDELSRACRWLRTGIESGDEAVPPLLLRADMSGSLDIPDEEIWLRAAAGIVANDQVTVEIRPIDDDDVDGLLDVPRLGFSDWLTTVLTLIGAGVGTPVQHDQLLETLLNAPALLDDQEDDAELLSESLNFVLPLWRRLGAMDENSRLTALGVWGLPRALARSWRAELALEG